jgi:Protein of unknown function (DUF3261)
VRVRPGLSLAGVALVGCTSLFLPLPLLHVRPADLGPPRTVEQRLQIVRHGQAVVLDGVADVSATRVQLIASALGVRLYDLAYDGRRVLAGPAAAPAAGLPPAVALDDFLLLYAPAEVLAAALPRDLRLVASPEGRRLYRGERLLVAVTYESADPGNGRSRLHNVALDYDLVVDSTVAP